VGKRQFKCTRRKASPIHFTVGPEKIRLQQLDLDAFGLDESYRNAIRIPGIVKLLPAVKTVQHRPQPTLGTSDVFYVDRSPGREIAQHHKPEAVRSPNQGDILN
jgi:hypothetical protein